MTNDWLEAAVLALDHKVPAVLATVVQTLGSTPRKAGARMVVYHDGSVLGTVGGGCGEAQVRQAALDVLDTGRARLLRVDLRGFFGDDAEVCGGWMEVLLEPLYQEEPGEGERA